MIAFREVGAKPDVKWVEKRIGGEKSETAISLPGLPNKVPQTVLETIEMYCLTVLEGWKSEIQMSARHSWWSVVKNLLSGEGEGEPY